MATTKQISATVKAETADCVSKLAYKENRSFSAMVEILINAALTPYKSPCTASKKAKQFKTK